MNMTFIYIAGVFIVLLGLWNFRSGITDFIYLLFKHWKHTVFILVCLMVGLAVGLYGANLDRMMTHHQVMKLQPKENKVLADIRACQDFVLAKLEQRDNYEDPSPSLGDVIKIGAKSYWDSCARTFGMNYWKYDISINGENGGQLLCRTYRQDPLYTSYRSGNVETWCNTVFSPDHKI